MQRKKCKIEQRKEKKNREKNALNYILYNKVHNVQWQQSFIVEKKTLENGNQLVYLLKEINHFCFIFFLVNTREKRE